MKRFGGVGGTDLYTFEDRGSGAYSDFHVTDFGQIWAVFDPQRYTHGAYTDQILCCAMNPGRPLSVEEVFLDKC